MEGSLTSRLKWCNRRRYLSSLALAPLVRCRARIHDLDAEWCASSMMTSPNLEGLNFFSLSSLISVWYVAIVLDCQLSL